MQVYSYRGAQYDTNIEFLGEACILARYSISMTQTYWPMIAGNKWALNKWIDTQ